MQGGGGGRAVGWAGQSRRKLACGRTPGDDPSFDTTERKVRIGYTARAEARLPRTTIEQAGEAPRRSHVPMLRRPDRRRQAQRQALLLRCPPVEFNKRAHAIGDGAVWCRQGGGRWRGGSQL